MLGVRFFDVDVVDTVPMTDPTIVAHAGGTTSLEFGLGVAVGVVLVVIYYLFLRLYVAANGSGRVQ
jgi:hypothetical protein